VWQFSEAADEQHPEINCSSDKKQMQEMIDRQEISSILRGASVTRALPGRRAALLFGTMRDFVRNSILTASVSYADDNLPKLNRAEDSAANDADFLVMNQYFGSWHGTGIRAFRPALDAKLIACSLTKW